MPLPLLRYHDAVQLCLGLRGHIDAPTTEDELTQTLSYFQDLAEGATRSTKVRMEGKVEQVPGEMWE